jgi:hypothetical protein
MISSSVVFQRRRFSSAFFLIMARSWRIVAVGADIYRVLLSMSSVTWSGGR